MKSGWIKRILVISVLLIVFTLNAFALDYPHHEINNIGCDSCHFIYGTEPSLLPEWTDHLPQHIDDTQYNTLCWSCHNDTDAPYVRTHSSRSTDNSYGNWTVECRVCHNPHYQKQKEYGSSSYLYSGTSASVTATTIIKTGPDWTDDYEGMVVMPNISQNKYIYQITDNTGDTLTVEGPMDLTKVTMGNTFAIMYGNLINKAIDLSKITITPAKSGSKTTRFFRTTGSKSFADGDATYDGVCEVCHTQTTHFRNNGSGSNQLHTNVGTPAGTNCITCHSHVNGFRHGGSGGSGCEECHGHDPGYGGATGGKGSYVAHSTHTENDSDDLRGPNIGCTGCHEAGGFPNFKSGTDSNEDGKYSLSETDVCNPCHSPDGTYNGVNNAALGAKNNWSTAGSSDSKIYAADGSLKAGKEKWCATCHDESPSVIQSINAPNVIGDEDGTFTYGTGWGYYKTGHGLSAGQKYPASGGVTAGAGKGCLDCHLSNVAHVDGNARTFDCSNGCDSTEYRQAYRLRQVGGQEPMFVPWTQNNSNDASRYRLCTQAGCHNSGPFTGSDSNTNFKTDGVNRHASHLVMNSTKYPADYNYGGSYNSNITCVNCHNVHGSTRLAMVRDGKLINREPGLQIWYRNDDIVDWNSNSPNPPNPQNLPLSASTGTLLIYNSSTNICAHCHGGGNVTGETRIPFQNVQQTPTLDWAGQPGYESDGVNPDSGLGESSFTFKVKYTDTNNDSPTVYQVWIDEDDLNGYEFDEKFNMTPNNPGDVNLTDGKIYKYSRTLSKQGDNNINYCFTFSDGSAATGEPACENNKQVPITNNTPTLAWTEEVNYSSDGAYPDSGGSGMSFAFRIKYTDKDNEAPSSIQIWVDKDNDAAYEDNADPALDEKIDMTLAAGGDSNYRNGEVYEKSVTLTTTGSLKYRFYASDSYNTATGTPTADSAGTAQVTSGSNAPTLSWTGETNYTSDGVDPDSGPQGGHFIFRVKYTDTDNNSPSQIKVWVDGSATNMTEVDSSDNDHSNGKLYYADVIISTLGNRTYTFTAKDSNNNDATGDPTSNKTVTITNAVTVTCPGDSIQTAINNASSGDTILVADGICSENINYSGKNITIKSLNGAAATTIQGTGGNSPVVTFANGENSNAVLDGFTIDNQNSGGTNGRGISISNNSSPTIMNSVIAGNSINSGYDGAGIYIVTGGGATIQNTKIGISGNANTARYGSGIYASTTGTISISGSKIDYNTGLFGPGIYLTNVNTTTTITGTSVNNNQSSQSAGGIYAYNSAVTLTNCTLNNNSVSNIGSYDGGGIYLNGASAGALISGTTIKGNSGRNGAGIYVLGSTLATPLSVTDSLISSNNGRYGAGIYITGVTNASTITNSTITSNTTDQGYAGIYTDSPLTMAGSHVDGNTVTGGSFDAAGLILNGASAIGNITNTTFNGNTSRNGSGFTVRNGASLTLTGGIISGNTAYSGGTGAIWVDALSSLNMYKSIVRGNWAGTYGGGIYTAGNTLIENCFIIGNITDAQTYSDGGGIYNVGTLTVTNSTIAGNYAGRNGGGLNGGGTVKNSIIWGNTCDAVGPQIYGSPTVTYSDIEAGYDTGTNIIDADPKFVDFIQAGIGVPTADGNFHIASNSPAKNAANNSDAPADDIDGQTRALTGGDPADMGADEYVSAETEAPVVTAFTASSSTSLHIPVTSFTATDNTGVTGYLITTSDIPPSALGEIWLSSAPTAFIASADGAYTLYPWARDAAGNVSVEFDSPRTVSVDTAAPSVDSTTPSNGATDVALNSTVTINWTENVDCTTVTTSAVTISPSVGWTRTSCSGSQAVFTLSGQSGSTIYTVTVSASIKDTAGNQMASGYQFSYTTVPPSVAAPTIGTPSALSTTSISWYFTDNASNEDGFKVHDSSHTVKASLATPDLLYLDETGLTANTQYTRHVHAYNASETSLGSSNASAYTWPVAPNVTADKSTSTWYTTANVIFTNAAGFGAGGVQYYRYAWDTTATHTFNDTETQWSSGTLTKTSTSEGSWYLHVKSYNADNVANSTTADYGPYNYDMTVLAVSTTNPSNGSTGVVLDNNVTINFNENVDCTSVTTSTVTINPSVGWSRTSCSGSQAVFAPSGQANSTSYTVTVSTSVKDASGVFLGSNYQFSYTTVAAGGIITVCQAGPPTCNFATIQGAINDAGTTNGKTVRVTDSNTYSEKINFNGKLITVQSANGAANVTIRGDNTNNPVVTFGNGETSSAVLDGFTIDNQATNTATRGILISGAAPIIKNSIITGNAANNAGADSSTNCYGGGGVCIYNSVPTFDNVTIRSNTATNRNGAGIYIQGSGGGATITNSTIGGSGTANSGANGGGIYFTGSTTGALSITNSTVSYNSITTDGPGIYLNGITNLTTITGSTISNNACTTNCNGGGIYSNGSPLRITNSHIDNNVMNNVNRNGGGIYMTGAAAYLIVESNSTINNNYCGNGGAIYITGSTAATPLSVSDTTISGNQTGYGSPGIYMGSLTNNSTFTNVTISNNSCSNGFGGGIYAVSSPFTMTGSTISGNTIPSTKSGGGICVESTSANISSTTIQSNTAGVGGGIAATGTAPTLTLNKVKVLGNNGNATGGGGGVYSVGTATITNSVIAGNISSSGSTTGGGGIYNNAGTLYLYFSTVTDNYVGRQGGGIRGTGTETIRNSIVWGNVNAGIGGLEIDGTMETLYLTETSSSPTFVLRDTASSGTPKTGGDYHLQSSSNCIDTGDATSAQADDIEGHTRPTDIGGKGDGTDDYDKGAYEYVP